MLVHAVQPSVNTNSHTSHAFRAPLLVISLPHVSVVFVCCSSLPSPPQVRVLLKSPKGPEVSPSDVFSYNAAFSNPLFRIKVNNIQMKETQEENAKTNAEVCGVLLVKGFRVSGSDRVQTQTTQCGRVGIYWHAQI
jgi:hypothetical protein